MASRFQFALPDPRRRDGWTRIGNLDLTTTALLVVAGVASMLLYAIDKAWFGKLVFHPSLVRDGELWRLVTWPLANQPSIWPVLTLFFYWRVGHFVEEMVGRNKNAVLVALVTVVPAGFVSLLDEATFPTFDELGLGLLLTVAFVILAVEHPDAQSYFGIPIWVLAVVFLGIYVLQVTAERFWGTLIMLAIAVALGVAVVRQWGYAARLSFIPRFGSGRAPSARRPRRTARSQRTVIEGPWSTSAPPSRPDGDAAAAQIELDALLDKISARGLDSLTSDEKRRLNELSKRLR